MPLISPIAMCSVMLGAIFTACVSWIMIAGHKKYLKQNTHLSGHAIHSGTLPRSGGFSIALIVSTLLVFSTADIIQPLYFAVGIFAVGFLEDITGILSVKIRMALLIILTLSAAAVSGFQIHSIGYWMLDALLDVYVVGLLFSVFCLCLYINGSNLIDGLNGLCIIHHICLFTALYWVAQPLSDAMIAEYSLTIIASLLGLLVWNFPKARIFLGDGGAYFLGFLVAVLVIHLANKHSSVSPFFATCLLIYPCWEVLRSIVRRKAQSKPAFMPDNSHLHSLVFSYFEKKFGPINANPLATIICLSLSLSSATLSSVFYDNREMLIISTLLIIAIYEILYLLFTQEQT